MVGRWASFAVIVLNSLWLFSICRNWVRFAVVVLPLAVVWLDSPSLCSVVPLVVVGCIGFAGIDPTCQCRVQCTTGGLVGLDLVRRFGFARAEGISTCREKDEQTKNGP